MTNREASAALIEISRTLDTDDSDVLSRETATRDLGNIVLALTQTPTEDELKAHRDNAKLLVTQPVARPVENAPEAGEPDDRPPPPVGQTPGQPFPGPS